MKIILIGNLIEDRQESMHRFTTMLHLGLMQRGHIVSVISPKLIFGRLFPPYRYSGFCKFLGYIDKFLIFPWILRKQIRILQPDVIHITDHASAVYGSAAGGVPVLTTCHDLFQLSAARGEIPTHAVGFFGRRYQYWIATNISNLSNVVSVSTRTRNELIRLIRKPSGISSVVGNALHYPYRPIDANLARDRLSKLVARAPKTASDAALIALGFVLQVGGLQWYKNRDGLIEIFAGLRSLISPPPTLVMVGPPLEPRHIARLNALGLGDHVIQFDSVSNEELEALYNLACGLLFPSLDEGFGWPVAEAISCGCPVFASARSPMTEVGGEYCTYFDPRDPKAAAEIIAAVWGNREQSGANKIAHARQWQPSRMLEAYESIYREIAS